MKENNFNFDKEIADIDFNAHKLLEANKNIFLTSFEITTLAKYNIEWRGITTYQELLFYIQNELYITDDEDLDSIMSSISERNYYQNTNK